MATEDRFKKRIRNIERNCMTNKLSYRDCPLCGTSYKSKKFLTIFEQKNSNGKISYVVSECRSCGFIHQNPCWNQGFYDNIYSDLVYDPSGDKCYKGQVLRYKVVADIISQLPINFSQTKILDYGCYDGTFIEWVRSICKWAKRAEFAGYDISIKGKVGGVKLYDSLEKLLSTAKRYNVVVMNHVLEHMLNPLKTLGIISRLLEEEGYIVIEVPDTSFINENDFSPFHIQHTNYFTPATISKMLNQGGYSVISINTFKNSDLDRDPFFPSLIVIGQKDENYIKDGKVLKKAIESRKIKFKKRIEGLGKNVSLNIVGCGDALRSTIGLLKGLRIYGFYDNNSKLWGRLMYGLEVLPVQEIKSSDADYILVCTFNKHNVEQIKKQLLSYVNKNKIITFFD